MNRQLELFALEVFESPKPLHNEFYHNWHPKVGDTVRCDVTVAYHEGNSRKQYCYDMRCMVIFMEGRNVRVSPTQEWCEACGGNGVMYDTSDIWLVDSSFIASIGN